MAQFQCICCGEQKESTQRCACPSCGYTMYALPFDRKELLRTEIMRFVTCMTHTPDVLSYIKFKGLEKDQHRFPDADTIQNYAASAKRTEQFLEKLETALEQITQYLNTPFEAEYQADWRNMLRHSKILTEQVQEIAEILGIPCKVEEPEIPMAMLRYREIPDESFSAEADAILQKLHALLEKIRSFIRRNSVYGNVYTQNVPLKQYKPGFDFEPEMKKYHVLLDNTLEKPYVVDLLEDGSKELCEMLSVFWRSIHLLLSAPVLRREYNCCFDGKDGLSVSELSNCVAERIDTRFSALRKTIEDIDFLADADEARLFSLYDQMLELDTVGYFHASRGKALQAGKAEQQLNTLIGLSSIKNEIHKIKAYILANQDAPDLNLHMCFYGNPGTGKTEVARIIAGILHENGLLPTDHLIETDRSGLVAGYVGQTALKTQEVIEKAMGGVLFIDEAYALVQDESGVDYGHEAVAALIKAMEDYRGKFCVILAGYQIPMEKMIASNPGFASRIQFTLQFPDYTRSELKQISQLMLQSRNYAISETAMDKLLDITDFKRKEPNFANAREVRSLLEQIIMSQSLRTVGTDDRELTLADVNAYIRDAKLSLPISDSTSKRILSAEEELEQLVGLTAVKRMIRKIRAYAVRNQNDSNFNLHMCFYGNPGTGKTEVARLLSRILFDAGILSEAKCIETDAHGLIGRYVGETAPKTRSKIEEAMGGVLFIDEAYSLTESDGHYGDEAIAVLLKEMEDKRGRFCAVLAGYKEKMQQMLRTNPGMTSRIPFTLDFPDYSQDELREIAVLLLEKKGYQIEAAALELILDICNYERSGAEYANARTLRNILDQVLLNQNLRTEHSVGDNSILRTDVEEYIQDEQIDLNRSSKQPGKIGFSL